jgi:hypothetical protein
MEEKTAVLERILAITKEAVFTGKQTEAEKEADSFVTLYERRTNILKRIEKIDAALKTEAMGLPPMDKPEYMAKLTTIKDAQKAIAAQLLALDEANVKTYEQIKAHIQNGLKTVRQTIDVNEKYLDMFEPDQGSYFDKKN